MAPKKASVKEEKAQELVVEPPPVEPFFLRPDVKPTFDEQWFDDPIEGEEAIRMAMLLQQKIEEKAVPIRTWLEKSIVPLLLQALGALVAHRPSNPCEYLAAYLIKYNPLKDTYPEDEPKPKKILEEEVESDDEDDPCGCNRFLKKETVITNELAPDSKKAEELTAQQLAKKTTILADAKNATVVPDAERETMIARRREGDYDCPSKVGKP